MDKYPTGFIKHAHTNTYALNTEAGTERESHSKIRSHIELGSRGLMNKPFKKRTEEVVQLARIYLLSIMLLK